MKRSLWQVVVAVWLATTSAAWTGEWDSRDSSPWHLRAVSKLDYAQPMLESSKSANGDRLPFLHLHLEFRPDVAERKLHQFRVTDKDGHTVADVHGFHRDRSLLVFEGEWKNLSGLYLDGQGHREPIAPGIAPRPTKNPDSRTSASPMASANPSAVARSPDLATRPAEGLSGQPEDLRAAISAGTETPRRARTAVPAEAGSPWEIDPSYDSRNESATDRRSARGGVGAATGGSRDAGFDGASVSGAGSGAGAGARGSGIGPGSGSGGGSGGGTGTGSAGGGRGGSSGSIGRALAMGGGAGDIHLRERRSEPEFKTPPPLILYLSCADEFGRGRIYQVDEHGMICALVTLPYAATGLALHRKPGLAAAIPRDRGKIYGIDALGKVSVILEDDPLVPQPLDVGIAGNSDAILIADNLAHVLAETSIAGEKAREYRRFELQKWDRPVMSVAVTLDQHVLLATDMESGVYRFPAGDFSGRPPVLPRLGGVAADTASLRWAAVQPPNQVVLFDGDSPLKTLHLPAGLGAYRHGLLSFAPAARVVVAAQSADKAREGVRMIELNSQDDSARTLFVWKKEPILDFVVGPRMPWESYETEKLRSVR